LDVILRVLSLISPVKRDILAIDLLTFDKTLVERGYYLTYILFVGPLVVSPIVVSRAEIIV
jgi:hypothetical protein